MGTDPVMIAYTVKRSKGGKAVWTQIGRVYPHETGSGLTVVFDALPCTQHIVLLDIDDMRARDES
ncbi:MAG: hypothetical protein ACOYM8_16835 [Caulobacterales bacterium]